MSKASVEETAPTAASRPGQAAQPRGGVSPLAVLALMVGLLAAGAGYWQMQRSAPLSYEQAQEATDAAANAVQQVLSFDYRDLDGYADRVKGLLTKNYVDKELNPSVDVLLQEAPAAGAQVQTTVHAAAPQACKGSCPADAVTVLVVIDKVTATAQLATPSVTPQRLEVSMKCVDGAWLVDAITYLGS
ncbi:MAG: hypothetical protein QM597_03080 [Aeromicrobium sp.]|uniref:hypothetical protein n=1 Tax=Aeromicrobium sp. TaxID=1871063 RepID=UPI0039E6E3C3